MSGSNQPLSFNAPVRALDKIFYKPDTATIALTASANPIAPTVSTVPITNPQSTLFFIDMQVSPDGSTWYDSGLEPYYKSGITLQMHKRFAGSWFMTASTITLSFYANDANYTLYYRLIGTSKD